MKVLLLTNSSISRNLINWLKYEAKEEVVVSEDKLSLDVLDAHRPDLIVSYNYRYLIGRDVLLHAQNRIINLHISFLPWNKGAHPNIWSLLENTPSGVTIHLIDEGIDSGDILLQKEVSMAGEEQTLISSYAILHEEIQNLFRLNWERIKNCEIQPVPQSSIGTIHYIKDFERISFLLGDEGWYVPVSVLKNRFNQHLCEKE